MLNPFSRTVRELEAHRALVSRYSKIVADDRHPSYEITTWDEHVVVEPNGDARKRVTIRAKVLEDLWVIRLVQGCGWAQPLKYRRKIRVRVRELSVGALPPKSLSTTVAWLRDGQLVVMVHLSEPPKVDSDIAITIELVWPGMCAPLMRDRQLDTFALRFATPVVYARYTVVLPRGYGAYVDPVGFDERQDGSASVSMTNEDGRSVFRFEGVDLPAHERVGMRLDARNDDHEGSAPQGMSSVSRLVIYRLDYSLTAIRSLFARRPTWDMPNEGGPIAHG
ncbi:hypothetical protein ABTZ99_05920 [Actinosynnema sp. NPDC002837]